MGPRLPAVAVAAAILICACLFLTCGNCSAGEVGKRIVVSIDDQVAYFLEDGFFAKSHLVSTGTNATPTPIGTFSVFGHEYSYDNGNCIQYYTMYYKGHLGFHSVLYFPSSGSWTGSELGSKASHGCIRQGLDNARWAYYWTPDGTRVDIIQEHFTPPPPKPKPAQGGSVAMGVTRASTAWYFAEGCTARGFDQFLLLMNPLAGQTNATISLAGSDGTRKDIEVLVPGFSRQSIRVNDLAGGLAAVCAKVSADRPVVAERSMYYEYGQEMLGGDASTGCTAPSSEWYFAEGTCRPGFDSYLCIQNPGSVEAKVEVECVSGGGIVVERPMYFNYRRY